MANVEIYIESPALDTVITWVRTVLTESEFNYEDDEVIEMEGLFEGQAVPVQIQKSVEDGPLVGVWFNAEHTPWPDDRSCARDAWRYFQRSVQCDPGDQYSDPDQFLQIDETGEQLIRLPG